MNKKIVSHYDEDFFRAEFELLVGTVDTFWTHDPRDPEKIRNYGFVRMEDGKTIFFHLNAANFMGPYGNKKLTYIPRFERSYEKTLETPKHGDKVVFLIGKDRRDRQMVSAWAYLSEYEKALESCDRFVQLEKDRLIQNPKFRCREIQRITGSPDRERMNPVFEGTKEQFVQRYPLAAYNKFNNFDPLLSRKYGDVEYIRWFERETAEDWEKCDDPRTTKLPLTLQKAREFLWACDRTTNTATWEVRWTAKTRNLTYIVDDTHPLIAIGTAAGDKRMIRFLESPDFLETTFESGNSQFEELWRAGHNVPSLIDSLG